MTDTHIGYDGADEKLADTVTKVNSLLPSFVVVSGDIANLELETEYSDYIGIINNLNGPRYEIPGNHDEVAERVVYDANIGTLRFAFTCKQIKYVGIFSRTLEGSTAKVIQEDLDFLESEVKGTAYSIVFTHHPYHDDYGIVQGREEMEEIMQSNSVIVHGSGHLHHLDQAAVQNGILRYSSPCMAYNVYDEENGYFVVADVREDVMEFQELNALAPHTVRKTWTFDYKNRVLL